MKEYNPKERLIVYYIAIAVQIIVLIYSFANSPSKDSKRKETVNVPVQTAWETKPQKTPSPSYAPPPSPPPSAPANKNFKTVKIGRQIWMAENLNHNVNGSKCYDENSDNCSEYGRLYNWTAAMKACPLGWHLPTKSEWDVLATAVGGEKTAGMHLKADGGWDDFEEESGNGSDTYGFAALPGGSYAGQFHMLGINGYWWSASESDSDKAYYRFMLNKSDEAGWNNGKKSMLLSARCVKD